jgi:hypothetical protein
VLGYASERIWMCEESILLDKPLEYSIINGSEESIYLTVKYDDLKHHFPKECQLNMKKNCLTRLEWINERSKEIIK